MFRNHRKPIMIIDDDTRRRKHFYDVLKLTGEDIYSASRGVDAMERLPREKPLLIVINMDSGKVDGISFIKELRTYGMGKRMKVIGVVADDKQKDLATAAGANGFLEMETPPFEVLEVIAEQLGLEKIEIPPEQFEKRREVVEEVVESYKHRAQQSKKTGTRPIKVPLLLPGGKDPLMALTEDAGKGRTS